MKCPHCLTSFHDDKEIIKLGNDKTSYWVLTKRVCPACSKFILSLIELKNQNRKEILCYPKSYSRSPLSKDVPKEYTEDYKEACLTLPDSAKASAALSRRCLQHILREVAKVKKGNLANEIQQIIDEGKLPTHLLESLDAIRNIGNFATHPIKSESTGEIIDVEPGEAEWNLDVLEALFDYYFVQTAILKRKRETLNKKLKEAGKPEMK